MCHLSHTVNNKPFCKKLETNPDPSRWWRVPSALTNSVTLKCIRRASATLTIARKSVNRISKPSKNKKFVVVLTMANPTGCIAHFYTLKPSIFGLGAERRHSFRRPTQYFLCLGIGLTYLISVCRFLLVHRNMVLPEHKIALPGLGHHQPVRFYQI